jgi:hypothetical protein
MNGAMNGAMNGYAAEPRPSGSAHAPAEPQPSGSAAAPTTVDGWYEWTLSVYLPDHPEILSVDARGNGVGITALAEAMARHGRGDASQYEAMKGTASEVAKRLRKTISLRSGAAFGVDTTTNGE